ncbi:hypothetical protein IJH29_00420 [Candidatus Saccharibacteria bacterium]|nr:hypothetical protein [Candidatus Saccharibacteria bacterium]
MFETSSIFRIPTKDIDTSDLAFATAEDASVFEELNAIAEEIEKCRSGNY